MPDETVKRRRPPVRLLLVPRRIDVLKDEKTVDTILRMEVDNDLIMVPIGPKLVSTLIEGLLRAQQVVTKMPTKQ